MLTLYLNTLFHEEPATLAKRILDGGQLKVRMTVSNQYHAGSKWELAEGWLRTWYIAESLAECAEQASCDFAEGDNGTGEFDFEFSGVNATKMADRIVEFAAAFDPENLEPGALMYDEAADWLETNEEKPPRFPELEEAYRDDLAVAKEYDAEFGEEDEDRPDAE